jgi:hypothetical protein
VQDFYNPNKDSMKVSHIDGERFDDNQNLGINLTGESDMSASNADAS